MTFQETGLPAGTFWGVSVQGHYGWGHHRGEFSNTSSIVFSLPNGTYTYRAHAVRGYVVVSGGNGTFTVNGSSPAAILVKFGKPVTYTVTFAESGLAAGTNWTVRVSPVGGGGFGSGWFGGFARPRLFQTTSNASMTFTLPNGTYRYHVFRVPGYSIADNGSHGQFNVTGASPPAISVVFQKLVTYAVTFSETGLPTGTNWTVVVYSWGAGTPGVHVIRADTTTITFELANGTYYFHVHARDYNATTNATGTVVVSGASPATIAVTFSPDSWPGAPSATPAGVPARA